MVVLCSRARVSRFLQRRIEGLELQTAKTVAEAAHLVDDLHPAAALVVADGTELTGARNQARALIEEIAPFDLPTIVCTLPTEGLASEVLGVGGFLIKPVSHGDVIDAIRRHSEHPRRLLVADDDRDMLRLLVRILAHEWETCEILTATSGREALGLAKQRPEVVLLDLSMPGVTGMDVIQQLRADPETSSIPIIVITARSIAEDVAALRKGEVSILKASSLSAGELARLSLAIAGCLAPQYTARSRGRARQDSFGAARA
jgi:CheY-like chemotaxis protein